MTKLDRLARASRCHEAARLTESTELTIASARPAPVDGLEALTSSRRLNFEGGGRGQDNSQRVASVAASRVTSDRTDRRTVDELDTPNCPPSCRSWAVGGRSSFRMRSRRCGAVRPAVYLNSGCRQPESVRSALQSWISPVIEMRRGEDLVGCFIVAVPCSMRIDVGPSALTESHLVLSPR